MENSNPVVHKVVRQDDVDVPIAWNRRRVSSSSSSRRGDGAMGGAQEEEEVVWDAQGREPVTAAEVFELIRNINDPEHPLTLEQLNVVSLEHVKVVDTESSDAAGIESSVEVLFTPTIPHCSMATLIGLSLRVKLLRSLPQRFKVLVAIAPGTHQSEDAVNKQLSDKERVAAALENGHLLSVVNKCIAHTDGVTN